jgi:23S rRNA (uracil1939-C5)-methyltransferase
MTMVELLVERPVAGGDMIARLDGAVVFVSGAIPGERVRASLTKQRGRVAWAQTVEVLDASADRQEVAGDPRCGGRSYAHIAYARQLSLKAEVIADAFRRLAKHSLPAPVAVAASPDLGYRLRARLHVAGGRVGFFREGTHTLCDASLTGQLTPETLHAVTGVVNHLGPQHAGLESVLVSESADGTQRVVGCFVDPDTSLDPYLGMPLHPGVTGIVVHGRKGAFVAAGRDELTDSSVGLPGDTDVNRPSVTWTRRGASFFQGNRFLIGALLDRVLAVADDPRFLDLYAGVGLFAVPMAARGQRGVAVEGDAGSAGDLALNAAPFEDRLRTMASSVESAIGAASSAAPGVVIVDPPRTGLAGAVVDGLIKQGPRRIVYVSCDVPTLARDAGRLLTQGYALTSVDGFDMFPTTPHIETLTVFDRVSAR